MSAQIATKKADENEAKAPRYRERTDTMSDDTTHSIPSAVIAMHAFWVPALCPIENAPNTAIDTKPTRMRRVSAREAVM